MAHDHSNTGHAKRFVHLALIGVFAVAFIGYFIGLDYGVPKSDASTTLLDVAESESTIAEHVIPALTYTDLQSVDIGPNRRWKSSLSRLQSAANEDVSPTKPDHSIKLASLATRSERRAFNGAPPVIPHDVQQMTTNNCLSCHGEALKIAGQTANLLPHPELTNCMQCHAPVAASPFDEFMLAQSEFSGLAAPIEGQRAWDGAPPTIPHAMHMRDNCLACHGPAGLVGLRTTHPERQSCLQCHAPSAELDQSVAASTNSFLLPPIVSNGP